MEGFVILDLSVLFIIVFHRILVSGIGANFGADETCLITAKTVLALAKRAKELFMSSKMGEKQQQPATTRFALFELEIGWEKVVSDIARAVPMCNVISTSKSPVTGYVTNF